MSDYKWRDRTDPNVFTAKGEEGFKHYRSEYDRLMNLLTAPDTYNVMDTNEIEELRRAKNEAAARAIGFSFYVIP
jgi:hypothetical protein